VNGDASEWFRRQTWIGQHAEEPIYRGQIVPTSADQQSILADATLDDTALEELQQSAFLRVQNYRVAEVADSRWMIGPNAKD
jgi:hypothetical protein